MAQSLQQVFITATAGTLIGKTIDAESQYRFTSCGECLGTFDNCNIPRISARVRTRAVFARSDCAS